MRKYLVENYEQLSKKAACIVVSQIYMKPNSVLGLATGSTPEGLYKELVRMHREEGLDFSKVTTFNLDEYIGLDKTNPQSYYHYMTDHFFSKTNIPAQNIHIPDGMSKDIMKECQGYEKAIEKAGGIDLQVLGIGRNGHIGFNEPNGTFEALTHPVHLDKDTIKANARFFGSIDKVPTKAISMGIKTIMRSKKILLLANGPEKADAIAETIEGQIRPEVPSTVLQLHPHVTVIVDKEAARCLNPQSLEGIRSITVGEGGLCIAVKLY